tara:strand:+ start:543 stop:716 length:174 start_codon:yes stop_codon:yes gene_type:complete
MHTIYTLVIRFGGLDTGDTFIHNGVIFKKTEPSTGLNCHTLSNQAFKLDTLVEIVPN